MDIVLLLLAVCGVATAVSQTEGPFGLVSKVRNLLAHIPLLGPMLLSVLSCNFCLGFWSGLAVHVLTGGNVLNVSESLVMAFAGGTFNSLFGVVMSKLSGTDVTQPNA